MSDVTTDTGLTDDAFDLAFEAALAEPEPPGASEASTTNDTSATSVASGEETKQQDKDAVDPEPAAAAGKEEEIRVQPDKPAATATEEPPKQVEKPKPAPAKPDPAAEAAAKAKQDADVAEAKRVAAEAVAREAYTEDEVAALNETASNFPEVAKALKAVERVAFTKAENAFNAKLAEITSQFTQQLAPLASVVQRTAQNEHEATILKAHSDAFDILPAVESWVEAQPSILKNAYNAVLDNGNTQEIIELFTVYKDAAKAQAAPAATKAVDEAAKQQEAEKQKRLEAQEGVRGRNTSGRATVDPDDFEGAFDKFAAA